MVRNRLNTVNLKFHSILTCGKTFFGKKPTRVNGEIIRIIKKQNKNNKIKTVP